MTYASARTDVSGRPRVPEASLVAPGCLGGHDPRPCLDPSRGDFPCPGGSAPARPDRAGSAGDCRGDLRHSREVGEGLGSAAGPTGTRVSGGPGGTPVWAFPLALLLTCHGQTVAPLYNTFLE